MVMVPPRHYCIILNPVVKEEDGTVQFDAVGQVRLRHADLDIRLAQDPFPLYPGEQLQQVRRINLSTPQQSSQLWDNLWSFVVGLLDVEHVGTLP